MVSSVANPPLQPDPVFRGVRRLPDDLTTGELLRQTLDETKELVRLEVALAREDLRSELKQVKTAGILLGIAAALAVVALALLNVAVIIALGNTVTAALIVALLVVVEVAVFGFLGYRKLPKAPLQRTRERLTSDVRELKEHVVR
jgi:Flp pilus assembly protein TadB